MTLASDMALRFVVLVVVVHGTIFIVGPVFLATLMLFFTMFSEYPITLLGLLGIPAGIYLFFKMFPEDTQKLKDVFNR